MNIIQKYLQKIAPLSQTIIFQRDYRSLNSFIIFINEGPLQYKYFLSVYEILEFVVFPEKPIDAEHFILNDHMLPQNERPYLSEEGKQKLNFIMAEIQFEFIKKKAENV